MCVCIRNVKIFLDPKLMQNFEGRVWYVLFDKFSNSIEPSIFYINGVLKLEVDLELR